MGKFLIIATREVDSCQKEVRFTLPGSDMKKVMKDGEDQAKKVLGVKKLDSLKCQEKELHTEADDPKQPQLPGTKK